MRDQAVAFARQHFGPDTVPEPLEGDASDRRFFRVRPAEGPSRVLMVHPGRIDARVQPFLSMARFLGGRGFPVPEVVECHAGEGILVLEDLGDTTLQMHLDGVGVSEESWRTLYEQAVDLIVRLQRSGTPGLEPTVSAYHFALDRQRLARELAYFEEHYVRGLLEDPLSENDARVLRRSLDALAERADRPDDHVLCHRDFHSRNLMLQDGNLVMIDFQDARWGPRAYDLASLLEDAYVEVPDDLAASMRRRFLDGLGEAAPSDFEDAYSAAAAQRTLKAVGTFAGQATRFGVRSYLRSIPRALSCARRALAARDDQGELLHLLEGPLRYVGES